MTLALFRRLSGLVLLALSAVAGPAGAALPNGYAVKGVGDLVAEKMAPTYESRLRYESRVMAVATSVNGNGHLGGFWLQNDGQFRSHSLQIAANPALTFLDTPDFLTLTTSDVSCSLLWGVILICPHDNAYGIRVVPPLLPEDPVTGFSARITPNDVALIEGSLPLAMHPGNFVAENAAGVIATTQVASATQFGVLVHAGGQAVLTDIPWLVAINDLAEPLVLAYDGDDGNCIVYGEGCTDPTEGQCVDEHGHWHTGHGKGHEEHGNGNGYGHDKCTCDGGGSVTPPGSNTGGALLLRLLADGNVLRYRFPATADGLAVSQVFPLAINDDRAILRGSIDNGGTVLEKRLLSCVFNPAALDGDADNIVDCTGGMTVIGGVGASIRAGTVLGFELNNAGRLVGNYGYNAAGVGTPFVVDITAGTPVATPLADLATNSTGWELNAITDINSAGRMTGYGYRDCGANVDAFYIDESTTAPASALRFVRGVFESPAQLGIGDTLDIAPVVTGGSGNYEFQVSTRAPGDAGWTLLTDWSADAGQYTAGNTPGTVCLRVLARDAASPAQSREQIVRYAVVDDTVAPAPTSVAAILDNINLFDGAGSGTWNGSAAPAWLLVLCLLVLRRRR